MDKIKIKIVIIASVIAAFIIFGVSQITAKKVNCSVFKTQKQAQIYTEGNPEYTKALDRDRDGKSCEALP